MPLHSCQNCTHFVAKGSVRCLIEAAQEVQDPSGGNRCSHFEFANGAAAAAASAAMEADPPMAPAIQDRRAAQDPASARKKWAQLFGDT